MVDGEIVVPAADGTTDFSVLQNELKGKSTSIMLVAFDLLYLNGRDIRKLPLFQRKAELKKILDRHRHPVQRKLRDRRPRDVRARLQARPRRRRLEGPGQCLSDGTQERLGQEDLRAAGNVDHCRFRLDGTKWDGLYVGRRKGDDLVYAGKVDHGFDKVSAADLQKRLKPLVRKTQPYSKRIAHKGIWVEPNCWPRSSTGRSRPKGKSGTRSSGACGRTCDGCVRSLLAMGKTSRRRN